MNIMNGILQVKSSSELWDFQKTGNALNYKYFIPSTPCVLSFFKRKLTGENTITDFKAHRIIFNQSAEIEIIETYTLSTALINTVGNFFSLEMGTCFLESIGIYYFEFTTDANTVYNAGIVCITDTTQPPNTIPSNALYDDVNGEYILDENNEYILIND